MTRLAILADIHGNLPALEAVIEDISQHAVDHVIVAGDMINLGPFSQQVLERITVLDWVAIRGNHEYRLLDYGTPRCPPAWQDDTALPHLSREVSSFWRRRVATLPDTLSLRFPDAPSVRVLHTFIYPQWDVVFPTTPEEVLLPKLAGIDESTVIYGHSHLRDDRHIGRWHILNPGSAGFPCDGIKMASYIILDGGAQGWQATFRRVPFDYTPIFEEYRLQAFVENCGVSGYLTIEELKAGRHFTRPFHRWHDDHYPEERETIGHVKEFLSGGDIWAYTSPEYRINME